MSPVQIWVEPPFFLLFYGRLWSSYLFARLIAPKPDELAFEKDKTLYESMVLAGYKQSARFRDAKITAIRFADLGAPGIRYAITAELSFNESEDWFPLAVEAYMVRHGSTIYLMNLSVCLREGDPQYFSNTEFEKIVTTIRFKPLIPEQK